MARGRAPRAVLLSALVCLGGRAPGIAATQLRRGAAGAAEPLASDAEATLAPALLDFTKELKAGVRNGAETSDAVVSWCKEARSTKAGMLSALQRQFDEAGIALKLVDLEEQRLGSEAQLANGTLLEQRQRLSDATATGKVAAAAFDKEVVRLGRALSVAARAEEMLSVRESQHFDESTSDAQSEDAPAVDEVGSAFELSQSRQMMQKLQLMHTKLTQEQNMAASEHTTALQQMAAYQDRLNSSLMDAASQVASISVETSRRKRERARLRARRAGLEALLGAVHTSAKATGEACAEEELHQGELGELVNAEKKDVAQLLRSLRAGAASDAEAPSLVQLSSEADSASGAGAAALRGAARELRILARRFPGAARTLEENAKRRGVPLDAASAESAAHPADRTHEADGHPLEHIEAFVRADRHRHGGGAADAARRYIRDLYTGLVSDVRKQAAEYSSEQSQCSSLARDAAVDEAALARSSKTVEAKLHMTRAAMSQYERSAEYYQTHQHTLDTQIAQLRAVATRATELAGAEVAHMQGFAQRLLSLSSSEGLSEEASRTSQGLAQLVEEHRSQLQARAQRLVKQADAVALADGPLRIFLREEAQHNRRLLKRASAESELLESRAAAKADDQKLGQHFRSYVAKLCAPQRMKALSEHSQELARLGGELRGLAAKDRRLAVTAGDEIGEAELAALLKLK